MSDENSYKPEGDQSLRRAMFTSTPSFSSLPEVVVRFSRNEAKEIIYRNEEKEIAIPDGKEAAEDFAYGLPFATPTSQDSPSDHTAAKDGGTRRSLRWMWATIACLLVLGIGLGVGLGVGLGLNR